MDGLEDEMEYSSPDPDSPHYELFNAAYTGKVNRFKRLALNHAEAEGTGVPEAIRMLVNDGGRGSLDFAAAGGSLNVCKYLLEDLKLDVDFKDKKGRTALQHAAFRGHLDTVRYLVEKGANADASDNDSDPPPPLHYAALAGDTKMISMLLSMGVPVDAISRFGTALMCAIYRGHQDAVEVLLDHGANPNIVDREGMQPLVVTIYSKLWESMELLLQAGANPNAESFGNTPLILAAVGGHADVITRLLEAGADPNYKHVDLGLTALELAAIDCKYLSVEALFPVTSRIPTYPDWSIAGLMRTTMQRKMSRQEKFNQAKSKGRDAFQEEEYAVAVNWYNEALNIFPKDPAVLSNMSACYARLGDGSNALDYANKCIYEKPEWPKAYYRKGVALNILKRCGDAADAFLEGLTLDQGNKELNDAYMKASEDRLNSVKVGKDNAE